MTTLYGTSQSRAARSIWALEELGVKYNHVPTSFAGETRTPEHLKRNPNGHVPVLEDDGEIFWESMAINLYLAAKYGKAPFWPEADAARGHAVQWSFWAMTEVEPHLMTVLMHKLFLPAEQRSQKAVADATSALGAPMAVLEAHLKGRGYLLGNEFTIADLNAASVLSLAAYVQHDLSGTPTAKAWYDKCLARPAFKKASAMK
ncbi:MAG TPA: glutathione S-transferase family protein [Candidatus Binataceae bacterium]|nr:glutathione S-transferase family protein [Candidatus Binataceae bacterium]